MAAGLALDPKISALLVMDYQVGIVEGYTSDQQALLARTAQVIAAARQVKMAIIYVVVGFRAGYPEVSERNLSFSAIRQSSRFLPEDEAARIHPTVTPQAGDIVVTKHRVSAFAGTDLDMILRANSIETMVLTGIATSGVILSTTRHGADADYRIVILRDCCEDRDPEVHRVLMDKVFPRQAAVVESAALLQALKV
jgi:nicotinamidase-related amidase